jgi:hypothetical protein
MLFIYLGVLLTLLKWSNTVEYGWLDTWVRCKKRSCGGFWWGKFLKSVSGEDLQI